MTNSIRFRVLCLLISALVAGVALAGGSDTKPAEAKQPGVTEYNAGVALMKAKKFDQAQAKFEAALTQDEKLAEAHNNLAYSLRK